MRDIPPSRLAPKHCFAAIWTWAASQSSSLTILHSGTSWRTHSASGRALLTGRRAHRAITSIMKKRHLSWEQFPAVSDGDTEFITTWDKVRYGEGDTPLSVAMREANTRPVTLSKEHEAGDKYASFISFAYQLQQTVVGNILLPVRALAKVFGVSEQTISRWRQLAEGDGFLVVVAPHKPGPRRWRNLRGGSTRLL